MSGPAYERMDEAVFQMRGWAAVLDIMQGHLHENAVATKATFQRIAPGPFADLHTLHMLNDNENLALTFSLNAAIQAAEELGEAWGELPAK